MTDVLIRARPEVVEHKIEENVPKGNYCFWELANSPKLNILGVTERGIEGGKIMFTDGENVYAEGIIYEVTNHEIIFSPLKRANYPQPKKAPTRGFTYVE